MQHKCNEDEKNERVTLTLIKDEVLVRSSESLAPRYHNWIH